METNNTPAAAPQKKHTREKLFLVEQAATKNLRVLPGGEWALHYPGGGGERAEKLQGLLDGRYKPEEAAAALKPDALIYNTGDLDTHGLEHVSARVRDISARIGHYDYERFANFVASMAGKDADLETVQNLYDGIAGSRIRKKMLDSFGATGRQQMETALRNEAENIPAGLEAMPRAQRILEALKIDWLCEDLQFARSEERDSAHGKLTKAEEKIVEELSGAYRAYVQKGDPQAYTDLVTGIRNELDALQSEPEQSASMEQLEEELEQYKEEVGPPGTPEDPAIPPEDSDEYNTPPPPLPGETKEQAKSRPIFEITPAGTSKGPMIGEYCSGRKSYFDIDRKTWSKRKKLTPYSAALQGEERQTISGTVDSGLKSIPIPNNYALDTSSLQFSGARPDILRDQNGCFYIQTSGDCTFSVDFLKEAPQFLGPPVTEDTAPLYRGALSAKTEAAIAGLAGTSEQKAQQAVAYIHKNHFYPGGGDLQAAQALQHKLRKESTGDNYIQNLDASEYLECYSANTLFAAMMRKAGVPTRLVTGHKVDSAHAGKAAITTSTGHAWAEIWDGREWRRADATPPPKPQDKKREEKGDQQEKPDGTPTEKADDGGMEQPAQPPQPGEDGEQGEAGEAGEQVDVTDQTQKSVDKTLEQFGEKSGESELSEATDVQMEEAQQDFEQSKQEMQQMEKEKKEMAEQIEKAESFKDLKEQQEKLAQNEILDDEMKQDLEEKLEAKENEMKEEMKDRLDEMAEDGFLDEQRKDKLMDEMDKKSLEELDKLKKEMEAENRLYEEYENIREEVMPLVEEWYKYFAERLPRQTNIETDEDSLTRQGAFNRRSVHRPRNLLLGLIKNPRVIRPSIKPRFMASIVVDVSGSMEGEKLQSARKLLVFLSELFSRISREFGYIRFSIIVFSDSVKEIKSFGQKYDSPERYDFGDGTDTTVKVRLMQQVKTAGGTNMLTAVQKAAHDLNEETFQYPDYASAFYFLGDGGDTCGNSKNVKEFMECNDTERGFGEHMKSAIFLGNEAQRQVLAAIFGDENTTVAPDFEELVRQSMEKFGGDIEFYMRNKTS